MSATEQATVAMSAPPTAIIETDLKLDNDEDHPRRLLKLPTGQVLAYGGDDGTVTLVASSSTGKSVQATAARRFDDDAVRALAVSANGKRVAVGFDSGATVIYTYEDFDLMSNDNDNNNKHPFLPEPTATDNGEMSQDNLFSQSDALTAGAVSPGETDFAGPCFDSPVRDLLFLNDYNLAIATESETGFCVVNVTCGKSLSQRYLQEQAVKAHDNAGVRSLAIVAGGSSSSSRLLASLGLDGRLCLWNVSAGDPAVWELVRRDSSCCVTKKDVGEILGADAWDRSCRPQFLSCLDAESAVLALPGATYLQLRSVSTDQKTVTDHDQPPTGDDATTGHIESIVTMAISPAASDPFVVTSGRDGRVIMWEIVRNKEDETLDATFVRQLGQFDSEPTSLLWDKDKHGEESLFVACANGTLMTIQGRQNIAPKAAKKAKVTKTTAVPATDKQTKHSVEEQLSRLSKKSPMDDAMDSDDDNVVFDVDDQNDAPRPASRFMDDEAADDESTSPANESGAAPSADKASPSNARRTYDSQDDDDDDEDDFEMPTVNAHHQSNMHYKTMDLPEPQPAFAPSSTPLELTRRYMCWNHIGAVTLLQGELGMSRSTVDIDFTDSAFRRPISFTDNMGFILGSLGEDGAIFATDVTDDDDMDGNVDNDLDDVVNNMSEATKAAVKRSQRSREGGAKATGSTVYFHRFETFGALRDKDWYLTLPAGERALGCACGESWAAVVTSRRFLRLFSSGGNQGQVIWLDGEPVTMVGRSRFLAVFYHESTPLPDGTQKLGYLLFDGMANRTVAKGTVSGISKGSSLSWAGFSNDGSLLATDTDGMVSMLVSSATQDTDSILGSWEWMPMLDTVGLRKSADDSYWPITMYDAKLICVPLKGGTKHPDAARRPVTAALGLRVPLARGTLTKCNALEELAVRAGIALGQKKVMHDIASEGQVDEDFEREYTALSAQVDKVTLKMFASTVEAGKLERSLDLVERLHLEKSLDLAMTIADSHRKLVNLIEDAKDRKFGPPCEQEAGYDEPEYTDQHYDDEEDALQRITPDANQARKAKRSFEDEPMEGSREVRRKPAFA